MNKTNKILFLLIFLLFLCFSLSGCEKETIKGEKGNDGIDGVNGKDGKDGIDGAKGQDAKDVTLKVDDELGVMWQYIGDSNWKVLISFDDLIHYNQKYRVQLNTTVGTLDAKDINTLNDIKYNTEVTLPTPSSDEYTFLGWFDSDDNQYYGKIKITKSLDLTAKWCIRSYLLGIDDAQQLPLVPITNDQGEILTDQEIIQNIKTKFLTEYCIASNYDETKTVEVMNYTETTLYEEMILCFTPGNAFYNFENNKVTLTEFGQNWTWILEYFITRFVRHSQIKINEIDTWTYVPRNDPRTQWFVTFLTKGAVEAGNGSFGELAAILDTTGEVVKHPINFMAMHFTNFLECDDTQYAPGTSVDKVIPFKIDDMNYRYTYNDKTRAEKTYYVYSNLLDALCPKLNVDIEFDINETYTLPTIQKTGYVFEGWFLDEEFTQPITILTKEHNDTCIYAKFTEKVGN